MSAPNNIFHLSENLQNGRDALRMVIQDVIVGLGPASIRNSYVEKRIENSEDFSARLLFDLGFDMMLRARLRLGIEAPAIDVVQARRCINLASIKVLLFFHRTAFGLQM